MAEIVVILSVAVPELVRVTVWGALVVPKTWLPKSNLVGESVTAEAGVVPVPLKVAE